MDPSLVRASLVLLAAAVLPPDDAPPGSAGHSKHGSAFDSGLRQRPWRMEGIGSSHFPITTRDPAKHAEVQAWFDQGNTLLHNFWFEEAERSFRWCLKLDPDCAMAYWGLARTGFTWFTRGPVDAPEDKRYLAFLAEAVRRKQDVTPRERAYIEAWADSYRLGEKKPAAALVPKLQRIVLDHPDDVEAKALFALFSIALDNAIGTELVLQQVFAKEPDHPGAHHYRIHDWDGVAPLEAMESCRRYGVVAPGSAHANHMPGHIYSKIGMWHEAARAMDRATRVELAYMGEHLALPFESWNYAHNRNYLAHIQEQLGMEAAAVKGARDLIAAPRDPEKNKDGSDGDIDQGMKALVRARLRFERWDELLKPGAIPWRDVESDRMQRAFAEAVALIATGKLDDARGRLAQLKLGAEAEAKAGKADGPQALRLAIGEGLLREAEGDALGAVQRLSQAAEIEARARAGEDYENDPPDDPWPAWRVLGDVFRRHGDHRLAVSAYERALQLLKNDAFVLAGLAQSRAALGESDAARVAASAFAHVWSGADSGLRWSGEVAALGLLAPGDTPRAETAAPERPYRADAPSDVGPLDWEPFAAPALAVLDVEGAPVRIEDFKGRNVILVFYLGEECAHCVEQLVKLNAKAGEGGFGDAVILGVSSAPPEKNRASQKLGKLAIRLLSDVDHANARRFASYDDFEEIELHSTILIDAQGRVHWKRTGGDPFLDMEFLAESIRRLDAARGARS